MTFVSMGVYVFAYMIMCEWVCMRVGMLVEVKIQLWVKFFHILSRQGFLRTKKSLRWLAWLQGAPRIQRLYLHSTGITSCSHCARLFPWVLKTELWPSRLHGNHFTNWGISPFPNAFCLKFKWTLQMCRVESHTFFCALDKMSPNWLMDNSRLWCWWN